MPKIKLIIAALFLIAGTAIATIFILGKSEKQDTKIFVEPVQNIATLATAKAHIKVIKEDTDNNIFGKDISINIPGTKRKTLLIIPATVIAGVDLQQVTSEDIKINEKTKQLEIVLPHATFLGEPAIIMDQVKYYSDEGLLSAKFPAEEVIDLAAIAQKDIEKEATDIGLLQTAEENAVQVLTNFFKNLDYQVTVTFE